MESVTSRRFQSSARSAHRRAVPVGKRPSAPANGKDFVFPRPASHLAPLPTVDAASGRAAPTAFHAQCPDCGKLFLATAVVSGVQFYAASYGAYAIERRLYCDHCNHLVVALQATDACGIDKGPLLSRATFRDARAIEKFLREHPQAAGVEQS